MDDENRESDRNKLISTDGPGNPLVSYERIKSAYIADGLSAEEIAERYFLPIHQVEALIQGENLPELRKAYVIQGIQKIQNVQIHQTNRLLDLETDFKKLRIIQLESELENFLAYFSRHNDFYKRHPSTGKILKNSDGIPMQLKLPNVSQEISQLKESVTMSEGVRQMLHRLDEIINTPKAADPAEDPDTFDVTAINAMFEESGGES